MASEESVVRARGRASRMNEELCRTFVKEAVAIANFEGTPTFHQISIEAGNQLLALDKTLCYGWRWVCNVKGQCGYVPATAIRDISASGRHETVDSKPKSKLSEVGAASESKTTAQQSIVSCPQADVKPSPDVGPLRRVEVCKDPKVVSAYKRYKSWQGLKLFHENHGTSRQHSPVPVVSSTFTPGNHPFGISQRRSLHQADGNVSQSPVSDGGDRFSGCVQHNHQWTNTFHEHHHGDHDESGHINVALNTPPPSTSSPAQNVVVRDMENLVLRLKSLYRPTQDRVAQPSDNQIVRIEDKGALYAAQGKCQSRRHHPCGNVEVSLINEVGTATVERQVVSSDPFRNLRRLIADMEATSSSANEQMTCANVGVKKSEPTTAQGQQHHLRHSPQFRPMQQFLR